LGLGVWDIVSVSALECFDVLLLFYKPRLRALSAQQRARPAPLPPAPPGGYGLLSSAPSSPQATASSQYGGARARARCCASRCSARARGSWRLVPRECSDRQDFVAEARSRPGALGGALVMPRKIRSGPVLPPPKFPGVAMESCLRLGLCWHWALALLALALALDIRHQTSDQRPTDLGQEMRQCLKLHRTTDDRRRIALF
jgi:hypothetical protein